MLASGPRARRPAARRETVGRTASAERGHGAFTSANANMSQANVKRSGVCSKAIGPRSSIAKNKAAGGTPRPCSCGWVDRRSPDRIRQLVYAPFMQSDMNVLRSSAFIPFDFVLQEAILLSESFFLLDRHVLMNFLRSSPFLSAASLLHAVILSCCPLAPKAGA